MPAHTVTSAMATDRAMARAGRAVSARAAAAGPIIRLNISSAPTTGTVMLVASAMTSRNASSIRRGGTPRASATSGSAEDSSSGRNMTTMAATDSAPSARMGRTSPALTPNTSPNSSEYASWAYWLLQLTNSAPTPSISTNVSAVATSFLDDPRSTAKNPVTPAITATAVAAIQVLIISGPNMAAPSG
jgi:hypothetical protein